ncbi:GNAT family N-acetyltransferase [Chloroflexus sp.]|uniref:GNAT family N-acetyltransferase n=1 Tax=Chloroflexus sp. TaxID=1904827 RepID=UPI002633735E|nr:GNAT family N-acetyltransferase [uncultured Chloroflexus sp.]
MTLDISLVSATDWSPVLNIFERCNRVDAIELPVFYDTEPPPTLVAARIGDTVVGGAALYGYFEIEAVVAVDPAWRRQGIGRQLIEQIAQWAQFRGGSWIALADEAGPAVIPFATALGLKRLKVEVLLELDPAWLPPLPPLPPTWQTRLADTSDAAVITDIIADAFGDPVEQVAAFVADRITHPVHRFVIGAIDGTPVATMRLLRNGQGIMITTFGVRRDQQGRGYGRLLLLTAVHRLLDAGYERIHIEVEESNRPACRLYRSCGFMPRRRYGQYGRNGNTHNDEGTASGI